MLGTILDAYEKTLNFTECIEMIAVYTSVKKVQRIPGTYLRLKSIEPLIAKLNLPYKIAPFHMEEKYSTSLGDSFTKIINTPPDGDNAFGVMFIGDQKTIEAAIYNEMNGCPSGKTAELYGYPQCCAQQYEEIQKGAPWVDIMLSGLSGCLSAPWYLNRFGALFDPALSLLPDYFPCSITCQGSIDLANEYMAMLHGVGLEELVSLIRQHLCRPVLCSGSCVHWLEEVGDYIKTQSSMIYAPTKEALSNTFIFDNDTLMQVVDNATVPMPDDFVYIDFK